MADERTVRHGRANEVPSEVNGGRASRGERQLRSTGHAWPQIGSLRSTASRPWCSIARGARYGRDASFRTVLRGRRTVSARACQRIVRAFLRYGILADAVTEFHQSAPIHRTPLLVLARHTFDRGHCLAVECMPAALRPEARQPRCQAISVAGWTIAIVSPTRSKRSRVGPRRHDRAGHNGGRGVDRRRTAAAAEAPSSSHEARSRLKRRQQRSLRLLGPRPEPSRTAAPETLGPALAMGRQLRNERDSMSLDKIVFLLATHATGASKLVTGARDAGCRYQTVRDMIVASRSVRGRARPDLVSRRVHQAGDARVPPRGRPPSDGLHRGHRARRSGDRRRCDRGGRRRPALSLNRATYQRGCHRLSSDKRAAAQRTVRRLVSQIRSVTCWRRSSAARSASGARRGSAWLARRTCQAGLRRGRRCWSAW